MSLSKSAKSTVPNCAARNGVPVSKLNEPALSLRYSSQIFWKELSMPFNRMSVSPSPSESPVEISLNLTPVKGVLFTRLKFPVPSFSYRVVITPLLLVDPETIRSMSLSLSISRKAADVPSINGVDVTSVKTPESELRYSFENIKGLPELSSAYPHIKRSWSPSLSTSSNSRSPSMDGSKGTLGDKV